MKTQWPEDENGLRSWVSDTVARHNMNRPPVVDPAPPIDATPSRRGLSDISSRLDHAHGLKVPSCRVYLSSDQALANDTTVDIVWGTEDYDTDAIHSTTTNTTRLTVPTGMAGLWSIEGVVYIEGNANGRRQGIIRKNGGDGQVLFTLAAPPSSDFTVTFRVPLNLAAADYLELRVLQNSGGPLNLLSGVNASCFGMTFIRQAP